MVSTRTAWVVADSGGKAHTLVVSLSVPTLTAQVNAIHASFAKDCSACKTSDLTATINDLTTGAVPQNVASYLQTHSDINYVWLTYNAMDGSIAKSLQSAGLSSKVKVVGTQATTSQLQEIIAGTEVAWTSFPLENAMWTMADQMARLAVSQWSANDERKAAVPPFYIVSTADQAKVLLPLKNGWPGPDGLQDAYKKLWGV
jgi:ribose transport system substrate-binding protein